MTIIEDNANDRIYNVEYERNWVILYQFPKDRPSLSQKMYIPLDIMKKIVDILFINKTDKCPYCGTGELVEVDDELPDM